VSEKGKEGVQRQKDGARLVQFEGTRKRLISISDRHVGGSGKLIKTPTLRVLKGGSTKREKGGKKHRQGKGRGYYTALVLDC